MYIKQLSLSSEQLANLYAQLQKNVGAIYLDSASSRHVNSNFSVFVWQPQFVIESDLSESKVYQNDQLLETSNEDPLTLIEQYLSKLEIKDESALPFTELSCEDLPFNGGAIGYWDYELGGRFETLPTPKSSDINLPNMFVGLYQQGIVHDHKQDSLTFFSANDNAEDIYRQLTSLVDLESELSEFRLNSSWQSNMSQSEYADKFNCVKEYLLAGDCYQINLAQRFSANYQGDEWQAYQALRQQNSAPFSSFIRLKQGAVLSVSPERFLQVIDNNVETKPIKGTRPRSSDLEQDKALAIELQNAEKDRAENVMIVDLLRNDLSKVAVAGSVQVPSLFDIESFPAVHHLVSTVVAKIRAPFTSLDLLRGAFPGGSITGAPKIRAMQIIHELEPHPRSVYCGAIGYIKPNGDMDTNITIRTLVCNQNKIHCWAGGGLVADSKCEDEYQETLDKVNKILPVLTAL